ncbi:GH25 family lysozyme [Sphingobium mellinum]|uniref:GH25 family lysozyme n=1 Tax=Sphingobium mellinum TaxID=1387166 RepID=UPI0030EBA85D
MLVRVLAGLGLAALPCFGLWAYARHWAPARDVYPVQGVAVSSGDGAIDWGTLAANGVDFVYIRAARGATGRDPAFARNWSGARSAGLRYGAVLDFSLCHRAAEQATRFITTVPRDNAALPPVIRLDFAPDCNARPSRDALLSELNTLVNLIESNAGRPVLLNVSSAFEDEYDVASGVNRTLWLDGNFFPPDYATRRWVMWTANDMRHIEGVERPVRWGVVAP